MTKLQEFLTSKLGKFLAGALGGGSAALTVFLTTQGCHLPNGLKEFGASALIAILVGIYHVIKHNIEVA